MYVVFTIAAMKVLTHIANIIHFNEHYKRNAQKIVFSLLGSA